MEAPSHEQTREALRRSVVERLERFLENQVPGSTEALRRASGDVPLWRVIGSFGMLEVVEFVEQAFGIEVSPLDFVPDNFRSLDRIADYVLRRHGAR